MTPKEEPEIVQEEDIPSDGVDHEAEQMMKQVHNDKLEVPPGEEPSADKA
jgi:hypothetical protein